jgi:hypothetical protein
MPKGFSVASAHGQKHGVGQLTQTSPGRVPILREKRWNKIQCEQGSHFLPVSAFAPVMEDVPD